MMKLNGQHNNEANNNQQNKRMKKSNSNCNQVILDHFWILSDSNKNRRCRSIEIIVRCLSKQLSINDHQSGDGNNNRNNDLNYCLERTIRGLKSSSAFSRHSFCVLLTKLLEKFSPHINVNDLIQIAENEYGSLKNIENNSMETELIIACTLFIGCLLKSRIIDANSDEKLLIKIFQTLQLIGAKKSYMEIIVCTLIESFFDMFTDEKKLFEQIIYKQLIQTDQNLLFETYLSLLCYQKFNLSRKYITGNIYNPKSNANFDLIIKLIKETSKFQPNIHPIIELFCRVIKQIDQENYVKFLEQTIDELLKQSDMVKISLCFDLIPILLENVDSPLMIKKILSPNVIRLLIQTLSNKQHPLNKSAIFFGEKLQTYSAKLKEHKSSSDYQIELARCLIEKPGSINFDELSRSKLLSNILKNFTNESIEKWLTIITKLMIDYDLVVQSDYYRIRCLQQITQLLKNYDGSVRFILKYCKFCFIYSYFKINDTPSKYSNLIIDEENNEKLKKFKYPPSEKLQQQFLSSYQNILVHLYSLSSAKNLKNSNNKLLNQIEILTELKMFISSILLNDNNNHLKLLNQQISMKRFMDTFKEINEKIEALKSNNENDTNTNNKCYVFQLFYLHFILEMFENLSEIEQILLDFNECVNRALKLNNVEDARNSDEPLWSDVLMDLLISMIMKSKSTKNVILMTFKYLVPFISPIGIQSLIDSFINEGSLEFQDDDEDDDDEMSEDNEGEEVGINEGEHEQDEADEKSEDSEDDDNDSIEDNDNNQEIDEEFKNNLMKALGSAADNKDDSESDYLSDTEMFKLDESLANVFRQKFGEKQRKIQKESLVKSFKLRILDLIKILIDHHPRITIDILFAILKNLFTHLSGNYSQKMMSALNTKCQQLLLHISKINTFTIVNEESTVNDYQNLLLQLLELQTKCRNSNNLQKSFISLTIWFWNAANQFNENCLKLKSFYQEQIETNLEKLFKQNNNEIKPLLFKMIVPKLFQPNQSFESITQTRFFQILEAVAIDDSIRSFKRCIALDIMQELFKHFFNHKEHVADDENDEKLLNEYGEKYLNELLKLLKQKQNLKNEISVVNAIGRLLLQMNIFSTKISSIKSIQLLKTVILQTIQNTLTKVDRKKVDKQFINKLKNSIIDCKDNV